MNMNDVMNLSVPQAEYLFEGFNEINNDNSQNKEVLEGADAIEYLIKNEGAVRG